MRSVPVGILCSAAAMFIAAPALAASDYYLVIDGVDGEASTSVEVLSWSWGTSNAGSSVAPNIGSSGQDGVSRETRPSVQASQNTQSLRESPTRQSGGVTKLTASQNSQSLRESPTQQSTGPVKVTATQNSQSLRESPTRASTGGVAVAAGDLDGDGRVDLANLRQVDEVSGFSITLAPGASSRQMCAKGKHIANVHIVSREGVVDFEDLVISSCDGSGGGGGSGGMTMSVTGKTKEFKGHVTLLK